MAECVHDMGCIMQIELAWHQFWGRQAMGGIGPKVLSNNLVDLIHTKVSRRLGKWRYVEKVLAVKVDMTRLSSDIVATMWGCGGVGGGGP